MEKSIVRQDSETEVVEIIGKNCKRILATTCPNIRKILVFYMYIESLWLRVFLDSNVLFIDVCNGPDPDDDLEEGAEYLDISKQYELTNQKITIASMKDGKFRLGFESGIELLFQQINDDTILSLSTPP